MTNFLNKLKAAIDPKSDFAIPSKGEYRKEDESKAQKSFASITINASLDRVWRAMTDAKEVPQWDSNLTHPLNVPASYPYLQKDEIALWKYWLGPFPCVLYDQPKGCIDHKVFGDEARVAFLRFYDRYEIQALSPTQTKVDLTVGTWTTLPVIGPYFDRWFLKPLVDKTIIISLQQMRAWCEKNESKLK